jgi:hypothetical protein
MTLPPFCDCHSEPMRWHKDASRESGGRWRCRIKDQEYDRRWRLAHPEKVQERNWFNNQRRLFVCGTYLGMCGFTKREMAALLAGRNSEGEK